ncbi:hypothetical protein HELRODRAFT_166074 [Helobdella robusta]|uniref:Uncharacterized protein n=1 Tax=Helobdella robusta TaxID=6412 RepID=T1EXP6_HELRO|nr:hypothetical protein HELRODRAFT_166074 [Helobdella robusta]ESN90408.1 hypothetical protein HELRODRAFT_166074 [Helobdella robusta]
MSTLRFFYNLGVMTYSSWMVMQAPAAHQPASLHPSYICQAAAATPGMYVAAQTAPTMMTSDVIVVANSEAYASGNFTGYQIRKFAVDTRNEMKLITDLCLPSRSYIGSTVTHQNAAFYYQGISPGSPYIQANEVENRWVRLYF